MASQNISVHLLPTHNEEDLGRPSGATTTLELIISRALLFLSIGLLLVGCLVLYGGIKIRGVVNEEGLSNDLKNSNTLNFLVVGDWGRQGLYNQSAVAVQMGKIGRQLSIRFVISAGDNFYEKGLKGVDDPLFTESFTNVYTDPSLQKVWFSVLGNHDYMGDAVAQTSDEIAKRDTRWFCKRQFYLHQLLCEEDMSNSKAESVCNEAVDFFFIDTTPFIDEYWSPRQTRYFNWTGLPPRKQQLQLQLQNLSHKLKESRAEWKIVVGHHTMRSIGRHGDYKELLTQVLPILEENGVQVYINGHDHSLQYIKRSDSPVHFITSGGGSKAWGGLRSASQGDGVQFAYDGQGFLAVSVDPTSLTFTFYDVFGRSLAFKNIQK